MNEDGPLSSFCKELDELVNKWRSKPLDDQLDMSQVVGALQFRAFLLMREAEQAS